MSSSYKLITTDRECIDVEHKLVRHIGLFSDALTFEKAPCIDLSLLPLQMEISSEAMRVILDFYRLLEAGESTTKAAMACGIFNESLSFVDCALFIRVCDFLEASGFLVMLLTFLTTRLEGMTTEALEHVFGMRALQCDEEGRFYRHQYRRVELIHRIMATYIPASLIPPIDSRMRRHVDRIACGAMATVIRIDKESWFIERTHRYRVEQPHDPFPRYTDQLSTRSELSLAIGFTHINDYKECNSALEIVIGDRHLGVLDTRNGQTRWYGEVDDWRLTTPSLYDTTRDLPHVCTAIWQSPISAVSHSCATRLLENRGGAFNAISRPSNTSFILDVSVGAHHMLVLTLVGLLGYGYSRAGQLGYTSNVFMNGASIVVDTEDRVERIWCCAQYSAVVTRSNRLYITGHTPHKTFTTWTLIALEPTIQSPISHLRGYSSMLFFIADRTLWLSYVDPVNQTLRFLRHYTFECDVATIVTRDHEFILVDTHNGDLYLLPFRVEYNDRLLRRFGGTDSSAYPFKLRFSTLNKT